MTDSCSSEKLEPWPEKPMNEVNPNDPLADKWGYLVYQKDGRFTFRNDRPDDEEIIRSNVYKNLTRGEKANEPE